MAGKQRGPGADNTEAPKKNAPIKSKTHSSRASSNKQRRTREPAENRVSARRMYAVYDGRMMLGTFILNERTQQACAWNAARRFIGRFGSFQAAALAIGRAAVTERQMAKARRRLNDPNPPFQSGLPSHFLRRG